METTAILLLHCPDQQGIISEVTKFITDNKGNSGWNVLHAHRMGT